MVAAKQSTDRPKWPLRNDCDAVTNTLVHFLGINHPGHSLVAFRVSLLRQFPGRVGCSATLDAAMAAFTSIIETRQLPCNPPNPKSLKLYISGLKALRDSLSNPIERYDTYTLCAAETLALCHVWMAQTTNVSRGHAEGLAHLISMAIQKDLKDPFLYSVLSAITVHLVSTLQRSLRCVKSYSTVQK